MGTNPFAIRQYDAYQRIIGEGAFTIVHVIYLALKQILYYKGKKAYEVDSPALVTHSTSYWMLADTFTLIFNDRVFFLYVVLKRKHSSGVIIACEKKHRLYKNS